MEFWTSPRGASRASNPNCINKIITAGLYDPADQEGKLIMARPAPGFFPVCILMAGALGLAACQNLHDSFDSLTGGVPMEEASATPEALPAMVLVSERINADYSRTATLEADNARLKNQLAGALRENAKLKKDLANAIDD